MLIGDDFDKIEFTLLGLNLVEPNSIIGDSLLAVMAFIMAFKTKKFKDTSKFFWNWYLFFLTFGVTFIFGGLGHTFYPYWGIIGKYPGWLGSIVSIYFIEKAFISLLSGNTPFFNYQKLALGKLVLVLIIEIFVFILFDLNQDPQKGLLIPALNTAIGSIICLGILGWKFQKHITDSFKFFWMVPISMIPAAIVQSYKISLYPWLDRNDLSHLFLLVSLFLYWYGIKGYYTYLNKAKPVLS